MAYSILDRVYSIFIDIMTGISAGSGSATFYNTDKNTSFIFIFKGDNWICRGTTYRQQS